MKIVYYLNSEINTLPLFKESMVSNSTGRKLRIYISSFNSLYSEPVIYTDYQVVLKSNYTSLYLGALLKIM